MVTKVRILNRDAPNESKTFEGVEVFIGDTICGTLDGKSKGEWIDVECKEPIKTDILKIKKVPADIKFEPDEVELYSYNTNDLKCHNPKCGKPIDVKKWLYYCEIGCDTMYCSECT